MVLTTGLIKANIKHRRLLPRVNDFSYQAYYISLPIKQLAAGELNDLLPIDRWGWFSFYNRDHGPKDGSDLWTWINKLLQDYKLKSLVSDIQLLCMPRFLGYVFNPVSFWLCYDEQRQLRAVVCEVNNTFGETHSYVCANKDLSPIQANNYLTAKKLFYVSPFIERSGSYRFRFLYTDKRLQVNIDYYDAQKNRLLVTSIGGKIQPLASKSMFKAFWAEPWMTGKVIFLIHWQALKLFVKKIKFVKHPQQLKKVVSSDLPVDEK